MVKNEINLVPPPMQVFKIHRNPEGRHLAKVELEEKRMLLQVKNQIEAITKHRIGRNTKINLETFSVLGTRIHSENSENDSS